MTFVGFGLGAIQTGLFLYEAQRSGAFDRLVAAEVDRGLVQAVGKAGSVWVNIAHSDGVERACIGRLELLDPGSPEDRDALVAAASDAAELATALPSVAAYEGRGAAAPARILERGLAMASGSQVLYAAENHNRAGELLRRAIGAAAHARRLQILDTVIGKMCGVVTDPAEIAEAGLTPMAPGIGRAVLVEEFHRILISRAAPPGLRRGLAVFEEKDDLLPFEEAKLFGHNAIHCLLGFLAARRGYTLMSQAGGDGELMSLASEAFVLESGAALVRRHRGVADPLFTEAGFAAYAQDLLRRMVNPWLRDKVDRVCRDPRRKLGYGDRLFGAMRAALAAGILPVRLAAAARAGVERVAGGPLDADRIHAILESIWSSEQPDDGLAEECVRLVAEARPPG